MNTADRFINQYGRSVTKIDGSQLTGAAGTDTYGDPIYGTSSTTIQAVYERSQSGAVNADQSGLQVVNSADIYLKSSVSVQGPDSPYSTSSTIFTLNGQNFQVVSVDTQQDLIHCHCEQEQQ